MSGTLIERVYGNGIHVAKASFTGFAMAGSQEAEYDDLFATFASSPEGQAAIRETAFRFALERMKQIGRIVDYLDLARPFVFLVERYIDLDVDYSISAEELGNRMQLTTNWKFVGTVPDSGRREVKVVIGRMNHGWSGNGVASLLLKPNCPLAGSGAWVREAFMEARPKYDGKGSISFIDESDSRWQYLSNGSVCFPYVCCGAAERWSRDLDSMTSFQSASERLCLLLRVPALVP